MQGLKKVGLIIAAALFGPFFLLSALSIGFKRTIGNPEYTKRTIRQAGFYESVSKTIVSQSIGEEGSNPFIVDALRKATEGDKIQKTLEPILDSGYDWLSGKTEKPTFDLNINSIKSDFESALRSSLRARAASLPACSLSNPPSGQDIFNLTCIPPGTNVEQSINDVISRVKANASIFSDQAVADGSVNSTDVAQIGINDPTQKLPSFLPAVYQFLTKGLPLFIFVTLLSAIGTVLLSKTRLHGVRKLGILLIINGIGLLLFAVAMGYVMNSLVPTTAVESTQETVNALEKASKQVISDVASLSKLIGIVSTAVGIVLTAISIVIRKRTNFQDDMKKEPQSQITSTDFTP